MPVHSEVVHVHVFDTLKLSIYVCLDTTISK